MSKRPASDHARAAELLDQGLSYYRVARIIGCSRYYLQTHFPGQGRLREPVGELDRDRARQWLAQGLSHKEIARRLGVAASTVDGWFPGTRPAPRRLTLGEVARAEQLLDDGASYCEVARTLECDPEAIRQRFPGRGWTDEQRIEYIRMLRDLTDGHWIWGGRQDRRADWRTP